ncbi:DUF1761 domain-containing protein [Bacteriovoracaceae bacterium]|nr:DUF1761 domain-containing protein [Bacteriovoracaceae bacterium]
MNQINHITVFVAAIAGFMAGALWYSPLLFLKSWLKEAGLEKMDGHGSSVYISSFFFALVASYLFAAYAPIHSLQSSLLSGVVVGAGWVLTSMGVNYQFSGKSIKLWLIDGGYHVFKFLIFALIFGLWK